MPSKPSVSVSLVTYNHAGFIAQALDSALSQRTTFAYEIIVGDDCSTDGTTEIIQTYHKRWPHIVKPLFHDKNVGAGRNAAEVLDRCTAQYVAFLEGDDYWTDLNKLQMQVEFLDRHTDCALCHHRVVHTAWPGGEAIKEFPPARYRSTRSDPRALAMLNYIQSCSAVARREWTPSLDAQFQELKLGDWPFFVLLNQRGWIGYIDQTMAHYRVHPNNAWNNRPADYKIRAMEKMALYLLDHVNDNSRELWKDTMVALAFKDLFLAARSLSLARSLDRLCYFVNRSLNLGRPFWILNRLWPYFKANYINEHA